MKALLSPIKNLFKKEREPKESKEIVSKPSTNDYSPFYDPFSGKPGSRDTLTPRIDPKQFNIDDEDDDKFIKFGLDSEIDFRRVNLDKTHKISKIYEYPDFDIKKAQLPKNFVYVEHDLRQQTVSQSSPTSSILRMSQLQNILPSGLNTDNSKLHESHESSKFVIFDLKNGGDFTNRKGNDESFLKSDQISGILGFEDEKEKENNILLTESDDNSHLMKLVYKLKDNQDLELENAYSTVSHRVDSPMKLEAKLDIHNRDPKKNLGSLLQPVRLQDINSEVDEDTEQSMDNFESFPASKQYIGVFLDNGKDQQMKVIKKPVNQIVNDDLKRDNIKNEIPEIQTNKNQANSKVVMKFKINPSNLQNILKNSSQKKLNESKSKFLDDTVPEELNGQEEKIETVNPKLYLEQNRFLRTDSGRKGVTSLATDIFSGSSNHKLNKRTKTEYKFDKEKITLASAQSTPGSNPAGDLGAVKKNMIPDSHAFTERKCSDFLDKIGMDMIEPNKKIESTLKNLESNIERLNEWIEMQQYLDNSDLLVKYVDFSLQKGKDILFNNADLAKLTIDVANLKNFRDLLNPFSNIALVNLIIANLQSISFFTLEKEDILKMKRKNFSSTANISPLPKISHRPTNSASIHTTPNIQRELNSNVRNSSEAYQISSSRPKDSPVNKKVSKFEGVSINISTEAETLRDQFFTLALEIKSKLQTDHIGKKKMIGDLFEVAEWKKIPQSQWREFLDKEFTTE